MHAYKPTFIQNQYNQARKIRVFNMGKRMSFSDVFQYVSRSDNNIEEGDAVVLANADVFFDDSLRKLSDGTIVVRALLSDVMKGAIKAV